MWCDILVMEKDCSVLFSLWVLFGFPLGCFLPVNFLRHLEPWSREPAVRASGALSSAGTHYQAGSWQLWIPSFQKFPEMSTILQNAGILLHGQVLHCLRSVNENFAREWGRPNLRVFSTLSSQDPHTFPRSPVGKGKTESQTLRTAEDLQHTECCTTNIRKTMCVVFTPEDFIF